MAQLFSLVSAEHRPRGKSPITFQFTFHEAGTRAKRELESREGSRRGGSCCALSARSLPIDPLFLVDSLVRPPNFRQLGAETRWRLPPSRTASWCTTARALSARRLSIAALSGSAQPAAELLEYSLLLVDSLSRLERACALVKGRLPSGCLRALAYDGLAVAGRQRFLPELQPAAHGRGCPLPLSPASTFSEIALPSSRFLGKGMHFYRDASRAHVFL